MTERRGPTDKHPIYEARPVPFETLSADDFERCVFACFIAIQSHHGLRVEGQPAGSGDGGFDVYGVATDSNRKLCVQCKRQRASLGLPLIARELAKVALTTRLEKSDVGVHFFICTGGVTRELRRLVRETDRTYIANAAQAAIGGDDSELRALEDRVKQAGAEPKEVIGSYVRALDRLVAWDMGEFDAALSPAWDSSFRVLERFFRVSTAVREHPRALFARNAYQEKSGSFASVVQPQLEEGELPAGLVEFSSADPGPQDAPPRKSLLTVKALAALAPGEAALVVAEGGAGKTTLLELVRAEVARGSPNSSLSVFIGCAEYSPGGLDAAVHAQLGVQSGSWRMLPDEVQILCDGINEASPGSVRALFGELKPLLSSNRISCIFTSREDSRAIRTVLPTIPCATLRLVPLSPGRVRALAFHELRDDSEVAMFADAHRAMATRASGPFLWTPFAVRVALRRWKDSRQLGSTLGDLLDAIVSARADRDLEIASQDASSEVPRASILAIASAMAFQMIIVDGQVGCGAGSIVRTLQSAMNYCADVLGADGLNSTRLVGLLQKHDLVQRTRDENIIWTHQLVAGALAAQHLAARWRQHLTALHQPLADDAWVFAVRRVPKAELDEYLGELFHVDLMLGARATAELPLGERDRSLNHIVKAIQPGQPEELVVTGLFALARVGTDRALAFLRRMAETRPREMGLLAAKALAYSGDRLFLLELGAEVDRLRQIGWAMSGGEISIWEAASLADRIAIARERLTLAMPGEPVNESLSLIGRETVQDDLPILETHFHAAKDITAWGTALGAIRKGDSDRAQYLFTEAVIGAKSTANKAVIMTAGHKLGLLVDVDAAFSILMDLCSESSHEGTHARSRTDLANGILRDLPLTATISRTIEEQLPTSTSDKKFALWQLATRVESPALALLALDAFDNDLESVGMAANFFLAHQALRDAHSSALVRAVSQFLEIKSNWFTFNSWRTLALASELGFTPRMAELLQAMIVRIAEVLELAENGTMPTFDESEAHIARGFKIDSARRHLEHYVGFLVPGAVGARGVLPASVLLKFLHFELASVSPGKEIVNAYCELDCTLIDDELELVRDPWAQRASLELVCAFGLTDRRRELLRAHLRQTYCHPAALGFVKRALEKCWDTSACAMVVETIASLDEWPAEWQQFFWDFTRMVGARITSADRSIVEAQLAVAKTPFSRRILRIWRQATLDTRVGLSRLEEEEG